VGHGVMCLVYDVCYVGHQLCVPVHKNDERAGT